MINWKIWYCGGSRIQTLIFGTKHPGTTLSSSKISHEHLTGMNGGTEHKSDEIILTFYEGWTRSDLDSSEQFWTLYYKDIIEVEVVQQRATRMIYMDLENLVIWR